MLKLLKQHETHTIYFTAAAIILSGFLRLLDFEYSNWVFNFSLFPYIAVRGLYYVIIWRKKDEKLPVGEYNRLYVYIAVFVTVLLSVFNYFSADFFVIFLIMVDFLLLQNKKSS